MNALPRLSSTLLKGQKNDYNDAEAIAEASLRHGRVGSSTDYGASNE
jgi:hypothetical protein